MNVESITAQYLLDIADFIYLILDINQEVVLINRKGCEILECSEEEIVGKNWFDHFLPKEKAENMKKSFEKWVKKKDELKTSAVNPILTKNNEERIIGWQNNFIEDEEGNITGVLSTGMDITEEMEVRMELEKQKDMLDSIISNSPFGFVGFKGEDNIVISNPKLEDMFGYSTKELKEKTMLGVTHPDDVELSIEMYDKAVSHEQETSVYEKKYIKKDGSIFDARVVTWCTYDDEGNLVYNFGTIEDISKEKEAEIHLKKSEEKYRNLVESAKVLICQIDKEGKTLFVNEHIKDITGYEVTDIVGKNWWKIFYPGELKKQVDDLFERFKEGEVTSFEQTLQTKNGDSRTLSWTSFNIRDDEGNLILINGAGIDITERREAEEALIDSEIRFRSIFNYSNDGYILITFSGDFVAVNPKILEMFGYTNEDLETGKIQDFDPLLPKQELERRIQEVRDKGIVSYEAKAKKKDGTVFDVEISSIKINIMGEDIIFSIVRDITEKKEIDERIKSSEALYRTLFENTGTGIMLVEKDLTISLLNKRFLDNSGYLEDDLIGKKATIIISENQKEKVVENLAKLREKEDNAIRFETEAVNKKGNLINVLVNAGQILESDQLIISTMDITVEKKLENILIESEERLANLVENIPIAIATVSEDGELLDANPEFWEMLGYDKKEELFATEPADHWVYIKDRERFYSVLKKRESVTDFVTKIRRSDGNVFWGSITAIVHRDISGDIISYQTVQDITSKKEMEDELRQQLMKYKVDEANLYAVEEEIAYTSVEAFKDLLKLGYQGVVFSRSPESNWREQIGTDFEFYKLAEKGRGKIVPPNMEDIEHIIEEQPNRRVILIDRLDYLIQKNGFENTLFSIYRLMDIAYLANHIVLLSIDSSTLQTREKNLLQKELKPIETQIEGVIPEDLFEVLMFIYQKNVSGDKPTISDVIDELRISRPTARKRIQNLIDEGYITETVKGRSKVLQVTQKGKMIF
jgi:PAS domain S-box-containing protein